MSSEEVVTKKRQSADQFPSTGASKFVHAIRELTEDQFTYWIRCLNRAVEMRGGDATTFTSDDRQMTVSYWYILMHLVELYSGSRNPFDVADLERLPDGLTENLTSMQKLTRDLRDRYKAETVRRYVSDLRRFRIIAVDGRGPSSTIRLTAPAIRALIYTMRHWVMEFGKLNPQLEVFFASNNGVNDAYLWLRQLSKR